MVAGVKLLWIEGAVDIKNDYQPVKSLPNNFAKTS